MAWELRNGVRCYFRKVRVGGKVRTEYIGCTETGRMAAWWDERDIENRQEARTLERELRERNTSNEFLIDAFVKAAELQVDRLMVQAGYHKHKGEWRRKRARGLDSTRTV